jgi:hypothetical protein
MPDPPEQGKQENKQLSSSDLGDKFKNTKERAAAVLTVEAIVKELEEEGLKSSFSWTRYRSI